MPAVEFLAYLTYIKEKRRRQSEEIKKIRNKRS